jgi:23S rRNA (adenine2503-C2)-methyltransferase
MEPRILKSEIDPSVNFVWDVSPKEALEARYVRRHQEYVACYLSTQTACAQACRMCHLTFTGQNKPRDAKFDEILNQANTVMDHYYKTAPGARTVHYNFMARGEPLESLTVLNESQRLFLSLGDLASNYGLIPRFLISTILPNSLAYPLEQYFPAVHPEIYYSLYSVRPEFRRRWLPRAMPPERALEMLAAWQKHTKKIVRIHHALIQGENDDPYNEVLGIRAAVDRAQLRADFTLVLYNPPSEKHGSGSENYGEYAQVLQEFFPESKVKVIQRVGFDVAASCGMFVS